MLISRRKIARPWWGLLNARAQASHHPRQFFWPLGILIFGGRLYATSRLATSGELQAFTVEQFLHDDARQQRRGAVLRHIFNYRSAPIAYCNAA